MKRLATGFLCIVIAGPVAAIGPRPAFATLTTLYSNDTAFSGYGTAGAGALSTSFGMTTRMIADDVTPGSGMAGASVQSITFSVANLNATAVSADVILSIYNSDGSGGKPGTLIEMIEFNPITFTSGSVGLYTYAPGSTIFTLPSGMFWAGESFTDGNTTGSNGTGITKAQLNNLGAGLFSPPSVGSSTDEFFKSTSAASTDTSNPAGALNSFGGSPVADFGYEFDGTPAVTVPEPSSLIHCGLAAIALAGLSRGRVGSRRSRRAS